MAILRKQKYFKATVLGANDGIVTTFAVVAGSVGADLGVRTILILGIASMIADAISMSAGDYLGERSASRISRSNNMPSRMSSLHTSFLTLIAFLIAGSLPLLPYVAQLFGVYVAPSWQFPLSIMATAGALFLVGSLRVIITPGNWLKYGLEMLAVGAVTAFLAYQMGSFIETLV